MFIELYIVPFLISLALTVGFILIFLLIPLFRKEIWRTESRHGYKKSLSRLGGVSMLLTFSFVMFFDTHLVLTKEFYGLLSGSILILLFGLWDDLNELGWKIQVFFQIVLTMLVFFFGIHIVSVTNPFGGIFIVPYENALLFSFSILLLWMFLVMNTMNWLDGLDGLCGGVSFITLLTIFFLSLKPEVYQPPIALLAIIGAGTVFGFLFFNMYPARILAGTVGSLFLGFLIAVLAVIAGTKIATALLVLSLPIMDAIFVLWQRIRERTSLFRPDKRHLHFRLLALGWSERQIAIFFFSFTILIAFLSLYTQGLGKFFALFSVFFIIFLFLLFVEHRSRLKFSSEKDIFLS